MRTHRAGFTLVELMIVVSIIGVLAALAIYGVARYLRHAKTAEATRALGAIENGSRQQYERETPWGDPSSVMTLAWVHSFCPPDGPTPASVPMASKAPVVAGQWDTQGWACLKFAIDAPSYYSYQYASNSGTGTAAVYSAYAFGDLDGNGVQSTFRLVGVGGPGGDAVRQSWLAINEDE